MTLYYSLVILPFAIRYSLFNRMDTSIRPTHGRDGSLPSYGLADTVLPKDAVFHLDLDERNRGKDTITFVFILILFIDSVNRVYRVQSELSDNKHMGGQSVMGHERMEVQARKFYSQRNMYEGLLCCCDLRDRFANGVAHRYLCGFTLFLSFILDRTYALTLENLQLHTTVKNLRGDNAKLAEGGADELKEQLAAAKRDNEVMRKQAEGLTREFNALADRFADVSGGESVGKKEL
ncbi:unnamed protein product [Tuber aestivum]|uniref:Endoplasmic reticulum transmembrane protein n=1 Tax=Tuber aestivum TaxID=59557 RepID=A0A292PNH2_9PEZI|nr:unnamed protein product [Tuber aestivum]